MEWSAERGRRQWGMARMPARARRRVVWLAIIVFLTLAAVLIMSFNRFRAKLRHVSPGSLTPPPTEPIPAPARGVPDGVGTPTRVTPSVAGDGWRRPYRVEGQPM